MSRHEGVKIGRVRADILGVATTNLAAQPVRDIQPARTADAPIGGRVIIVDQQAMIAESLALVLNMSEVITAIIRDTSIDAVLRQVRAFDPDLVLVSATAADAVNTVRTLTRAAAKVVVVTDGNDRIRVACCIEAGATGAVATSDPVDSLLSAVRETVAGRRLLSPTTERDLLGELQLHRRDSAMRLAKFQNLSNRESEVLWALMMGRPAGEIAESPTSPLPPFAARSRPFSASLRSTRSSPRWRWPTRPVGPGSPSAAPPANAATS